MTDRIVECVDRGRVALDQFSAADQATADAAVTAIVWSLYRPTNAWELAELAVAETGQLAVTETGLGGDSSSSAVPFRATRQTLRIRTTTFDGRRPDGSRCP